MSTLAVRPLNGSLGAEVGGVALGGDLEPDDLEQLRTALLRHRVVFLRGQEHLDDAGQLAFAGLLGPTTAANPLAEGIGDGAAHTVAIDSNHLRANAWHTDATFVDRPPSVSVLRAVSLPAVGGDTLWADTVAAYESLPEPLRRLAESLWARHTNVFDYTAHEAPENAGFFQSGAYAQTSNTAAFVTDHPVVRVHPETGERALLLGLLVDRILGVDARDAADLLALFQRHVERPDNTVRWTWAPGDVAIWDNRSTQHYAVSDYREHRLLRRVTIAGEIPVNVAGEQSRAVAGDASTFSVVHTPARRAAA
ncbi:TauD/TfdA family dioxygenase [Pseudonocardia ailaonensis]|uniref:TauD/TfdA family dioxygenase n=1 Tax=Pseudonocardia ailaonensis TaxID=367279 RepID=A0ABN2MJ71_9PSEU